MIAKVKNTPEGLVFYFPQTYTTIRLDRNESKMFGARAFPEDTPPEVVHLEISDRCNLNCPYCYVKDKSKRELPTEGWEKIIKDLADSGVFQLTFGGGEPTMRKDLPRLTKYVKSLGLTLCMTSNGLKIPEMTSDTLRLFDQINISWHNQHPFFEVALYTLACVGVKRGINFCLSKQYEKDLDFIKRVADQWGAEILFLTYKPVNGDFENQIPPQKVYQIAKELNDSGLAVAVDGLTCQTCLASKRFCDIDSLGNVMVCSFLREPVGNLLTENLKTIWAKRPKQITCPYLKQ